MLKTFICFVGCLLVATAAFAQPATGAVGPAAEPATLALLGAGLLGLGEATRRRLHRNRPPHHAIRRAAAARALPVETGRSQ